MKYCSKYFLLLFMFVGALFLGCSNRVSSSSCAEEVVVPRGETLFVGDRYVLRVDSASIVEVEDLVSHFGLESEIFELCFIDSIEKKRTFEVWVCRDFDNYSIGRVCSYQRFKSRYHNGILSIIFNGDTLKK